MRTSVGAVVVLLGALVLVGCAGSRGAPSGEAAFEPAEVADAADCAVRDAVEATGAGGGDGLPPAPAAGAVPDGFQPVAAVQCRVTVTMHPDPPAPTLLPDLSVPLDPDPPAATSLPDLSVPPDPGTGPGAEPGVPPAGPEAGTEAGVEAGPEAGAGAADPQADTGAAQPSTGTEPTAPVGTVDAVRLEGDLGPLLAQLRRPDVAPVPDQACMAMFQVVPLLYLVDADGRAVHVRWPTDSCGFLLDGAIESLSGLHETARTVVPLS